MIILNFNKLTMEEKPCRTGYLAAAVQKLKKTMMERDAARSAEISVNFTYMPTKAERTSLKGNFYVLTYGCQSGQ